MDQASQALAFEHYVRNVSYLSTGNFSDLTLRLGEKSWQIHNAIVVCHSKWFQKALTSGLKETTSGVVTLQDDLEYANAVDCMVSYFYEASYNVSKYNTSETLLHAQVAIIADKYDCASLYNLAKTLFANTVKAIKSDDWAMLATFIYAYTTTEAPAHVELRDLLVTAVTGRHSVLKSTLQNGNVVDLLRSNAELATDLLLGGQHRSEAEYGPFHFICDHCHYSHSGSRNCPNVKASNGFNSICPECKEDTATVYNQRRSVAIYPAFPCPLCDDFHTVEPEAGGSPSTNEELAQLL